MRVAARSETHGKHVNLSVDQFSLTLTRRDLVVSESGERTNSTPAIIGPTIGDRLMKELAIGCTSEESNTTFLKEPMNLNMFNSILIYLTLILASFLHYSLARSVQLQLAQSWHLFHRSRLWNAKPLMASSSGAGSMPSTVKGRQLS